MNKVIDETYERIQDAEKRKEELSKVADTTNLTLRISKDTITLNGSIDEYEN